MTTDFDRYLASMEIILKQNSISFQKKEIQYGVQYSVISFADKASIAVYNGKKGLKVVLTGKDSALKTQLEQLLNVTNDNSFQLSRHCLLADCASFHGKWCGSDESGKGDFIGSLSVAAVFADTLIAKKLVALGVKDCKVLNDKNVLQLAAEIKQCTSYKVLSLTPKQYNFRYAQIKARGQNLNNLLAFGHVAVLSDVLKQCPTCNYVLVDRFAVNNEIGFLIRQSFPAVNVVQRPKAEEDIAVAAASVLARAEFLQIRELLQTELNMELPKGGGTQATECAVQIAKLYGQDRLSEYVKLHFANYQKVIASL